MESPVWFVTGVSSGFGQMLAHRVLRAGHRLIGSARDRSKPAIKDLEAKGAKIIELDTAAPQQDVIDKVGAAVHIYGHIDILVNNAAYAAIGILEGFSDEEVTRQFRTNVFGPLYVIQGVLPSMRARNSGTIVNISSFAGQCGQAADGLYASSKFALEGLTESMCAETAEFGITWLMPEFGAFRTNLLGKDARGSPSGGLPSGYEGSAAEKGIVEFNSWDRKQPGDPAKGAERLFEVITGSGSDKTSQLKGNVLRVAIGKDSIQVIAGKIANLKHDLELAKEVEEAESTAL